MSSSNIPIEPLDRRQLLIEGGEDFHSLTEKVMQPLEQGPPDNRWLILLAQPEVVPLLHKIPAAIDALLDCPCDPHRRALHRALTTPGAPGDGQVVCRLLMRATASKHQRWRRLSAQALGHCDRLSDRRVSKEIRRRLLPWALGRAAPAQA